MRAGQGRSLRRLVPSSMVVRRRYRRLNAGRAPRLWRPRDLSEKLSWLKLNRVSKLQVQCVDKLAVREYVARTLGIEPLVPLLFHTSDPDHIRPDVITARQFVLKTTHDSGGVAICWDRETFDWARARDFLRWRLSQNYYWHARERPYKPVRPHIVAEALLPSTPARPLRDYKLWCFHGRVELIQMVFAQAAFDAGGFEAAPGEGTDVVRDAFLTRDWQPTGYRLKNAPYEGRIPQPARLKEMIAMAEALAKPFPFVRVDLFETAEGLRFGELTFYPMSGHQRFADDAVERRLGDLLRLGR